MRRSKGMNIGIQPAKRTIGFRRALVWDQSTKRPRRAVDVCRSFAAAQTEEPKQGIQAEEEEDPIVRRQRVEAVLILSKTPVSTRKVAQLAGLADATEARTLIRQLNEIYDEMGRAFRAEEVAGGYQLLTRASLAPWLRRLGHVPPEIRLSSPAMETLAIVAYRHPVLRADIEAIRGVACGDLLRQLMDRDLVRICGRSEDLGRPYLYGTTKRFLQVFGLRSTDALPKADFSFETLPTDLDENSDPNDSPSSPLDSGDSEQEPDVTTALAPATLDANTDADLQADQAISPAAADGPHSSSREATASVDDDEDWEDDDVDDEDEDEDDVDVDADDDVDVDVDEVDDEIEEDDVEDDDVEEEDEDWDDDWDDEDDDLEDDDDEEELDEEDDELDEWEEVGDDDLDDDVEDDDEEDDEEEWD